MSQTLPPPPYQAPVSDPNGMVSYQWSKFFQIAFARMGGQNAPTNLELASTSTTNVSALQAAVTVLQAQVATLQTTQDFNQGRAL